MIYDEIWWLSMWINAVGFSVNNPWLIHTAETADIHSWGSLASGNESKRVRYTASSWGRWLKEPHHTAPTPCSTPLEFSPLNSNDLQTVVDWNLILWVYHVYMVLYLINDVYISTHSHHFYVHIYLWLLFTSLHGLRHRLQALRQTLELLKTTETREHVRTGEVRRGEEYKKREIEEYRIIENIV